MDVTKHNYDNTGASQRGKTNGRGRWLPPPGIPLASEKSLALSWNTGGEQGSMEFGEENRGGEKGNFPNMGLVANSFSPVCFLSCCLSCCLCIACADNARFCMPLKLFGMSRSVLFQGGDLVKHWQSTRQPGGLQKTPWILVFPWATSGEVGSIAQSSVHGLKVLRSKQQQLHLTFPTALNHVTASVPPHFSLSPPFAPPLFPVSPRFRPFPPVSPSFSQFSPAFPPFWQMEFLWYGYNLPNTKATDRVEPQYLGSGNAMGSSRM